jgi:hypothetical protein
VSACALCAGPHDDNECLRPCVSRYHANGSEADTLRQVIEAIAEIVEEPV